MPHQCTKCGIVFPDAAEELLKGCSCGSRFFYYIKQEKMDSLEAEKEVQEKIQQLDKADKIQIEKDIREISGMEDEPEKPVILDLESVKVLEPGKFEIDIINLFAKKRPLIYKLEEGKYIIDLSSSFKVDGDVVGKKIKNPNVVLSREEKVGRVVGGGLSEEGFGKGSEGIGSERDLEGKDMGKDLWEDKEEIKEERSLDEDENLGERRRLVEGKKEESKMNENEEPIDLT